MPRTRSTVAVEAWRSLLLAFTGVHEELAHEMEQELGLPIERYEILMMLYESGGDGMRPSEIAEQRRLSRSGATRLIDRLESDGLVDRRACGDDRRGNVVSLTKSGRKTFTAAGRLHIDGIERHVGAKLTRTEMIEAHRILSKLSSD